MIAVSLSLVAFVLRGSQVFSSRFLLKNIGVFLCYFSGLSFVLALGGSFFASFFIESFSFLFSQLVGYSKFQV